MPKMRDGNLCREILSLPNMDLRRHAASHSGILNRSDSQKAMSLSESGAKFTSWAGRETGLHWKQVVYILQEWQIEIAIPPGREKYHVNITVRCLCTSYFGTGEAS